jgi:hypothetical protein
MVDLAFHLPMKSGLGPVFGVDDVGPRLRWSVAGGGSLRAATIRSQLFIRGCKSFYED